MTRVLAFALVLAGCGDPPLTIDARAWPEADQLFHQDVRWLGGDGAYSIDLDGGRVLWLFGDSFIATDDSGDRAHAVMVRNSAAIQTGYDPSNASMKFFWGSDASGKPTALLPDDGTAWFWPGSGTRLPDGRIALFLMRVEASEGGLGFTNAGFDLRAVSDDPRTWASAPSLAPAQNHWGLLAGTGGAQITDDGVIAFATQEPSHDLFIARWPIGHDADPSWWNGFDFVPQTKLTRAPQRVIAGSSTELSVSPFGTQFVELESHGFGGTSLVMRIADTLTGPWHPPVVVYTPPESRRADAIVYAGKAHPELQGAAIIATYASNSLDFATLVADPSLYYPRFVKIDLRY